jgi:tRNA threonylcarbamoyladenosine modification (KEOPS) complex  Pcc1 subunit
MEYTATLFAKGDPEKLIECLAPEETSFDRSSFTVKKTNDGVEFDIKASDAVALRATLNTISQLLIVFEGAQEGKNG